ncbi:MAG: phenylacetate--CoA ligase family protein [Kosmotogaceae bacterium]
MYDFSKDYGLLIEEQNIQLQKSVSYAYANVPYYNHLFDDLRIHPKDIKTRKDLENLPILTKQEIRDNFEDFTPKNLSDQKYFDNRTSGSTGVPLKYRFSKYDRLLGGCLVYRGWSIAGYELGDKMIFLAGIALGLNYKNKLIKKFHETTRNIKKLSSYAMDEKSLTKYWITINKIKPKFIRGLPTSIYLFAQWLEERNLSIYSPNAVFTTAEKLFPHQRQKIGKIFDCQVYDGYGLNDGGVSAFELLDHSGMRIDTERAVMEIVDKDGKQLTKGTGRIIATSLFNKAFPFIRYDTGDIGTVKIKPDGTHILTELIGRQDQMLQTPEGKFIHGTFFDILMRDLDNIKKFQVIQTDLKNLTIKIVPGENFDKTQLSMVTDMIRDYSKEWQAHFEFVDEIKTTEAGKFRYVINLLEK